MIAAGLAGPGEGADLWRPPKLAGHHDQRVGKEAARFEIVEERRDAAVGRREQKALEIRPGRLVGIPGLVVAEIHLHHPHTSLDEPGREQQRPPEGILAIRFPKLRIGLRDVERARHLGVEKERRRHAAIAIERPLVGGLLEIGPLLVDPLAEGEPIEEPAPHERLRHGEIERTELEGLLRRAVVMVEEVFGVGPVIDRVVGGAVEEERLVLPAEERGELPGDHAASAMNELLGKHDRRREIVPGGNELLGKGRQRRPVRLFRGAGIEAERDV